jgi:hypothetical protein
MDKTSDKDDVTRSIPVIDWRTIDPAMIRGEGIPIEELLTYREKLDELLRNAPGQFVLIVGREIIACFPDFDGAAELAAEHFGGRKVLIKKIAPTEPIHSLGGAKLKPHYAIGATLGSWLGTP